MSSRKERAVTSNSNAAVDPDGNGGLIGATMGNAGDVGDGQEGMKVFTSILCGGPDRCFKLEQPWPRP
jgi:hypothetical protein